MRFTPIVLAILSTLTFVTTAPVNPHEPVGQAGPVNPGAAGNQGVQLKYVCLADRCGRTYNRLYDLKLHYGTKHSNGNPKLECCGKSFSTEKELKRHTDTVYHHGGTSQIRTTATGRVFSTEFQCRHCAKTFTRKDNLGRHYKSHKSPQGEDSGTNIRETEPVSTSPVVGNAYGAAPGTPVDTRSIVGGGSEGNAAGGSGGANKRMREATDSAGGANKKAKLTWQGGSQSNVD